jgi:hypothetical protein
MSRFFLVLLAGSFCFACSATRKISNVGLRDISSVQAAETVSERRLRASQVHSFAKDCPVELAEEFSFLVMDRVEFPPCPEKMVVSFASAAHYLKSDERTSVEEAINSQCRSLGSVTDGTALDLIFPDSELANLSARSPGSKDAELNNLGSAIQELIGRHLVLDRWVRQNGDFTLPEDVLQHLEQIIVGRKCHLSDDEVDQSYRTIRVLEDVAKILPPGKQRAHIERFLRGIYEIQDRKIEEFFRK